MKKNVYLEDVMKHLSPHGNIISRAMFGGYGIYLDGVIFASIVQDKLYFRVDEVNRADYEPFGSLPFIYEGMGKPVEMPYLTLPDEILMDPKRLRMWIQKAYESSLRHKMKKGRKKKTRRTMD